MTIISHQLPFHDDFSKINIFCHFPRCGTVFLLSLQQCLQKIGLKTYFGK